MGAFRESIADAEGSFKIQVRTVCRHMTCGTELLDEDAVGRLDDVPVRFRGREHGHVRLSGAVVGRVG